MATEDAAENCVKIPTCKVETDGLKKDIVRLEDSDKIHFESYGQLSRRISTPVAYILTAMSAIIGFLSSQLLTRILGG
jgi:hypothetical protein